jgi:hypothetical protein
VIAAMRPTGNTGKLHTGTACLPLPSVFCPAMRAAATRLPPTGWHGCRFPLVRWHRARSGAGKFTTMRVILGRWRRTGPRWNRPTWR